LAGNPPLPIIPSFVYKNRVGAAGIKKHQVSVTLGVFGTAYESLVSVSFLTFLVFFVLPANKVTATLAELTKVPATATRSVK
jgi:hypothetical protein